MRFLDTDVVAHLVVWTWREGSRVEDGEVVLDTCARRQNSESRSQNEDTSEHVAGSTRLVRARRSGLRIQNMDSVVTEGGGPMPPPSAVVLP